MSSEDDADGVTLVIDTASSGCGCSTPTARAPKPTLTGFADIAAACQANAARERECKVFQGCKYKHPVVVKARRFRRWLFPERPDRIHNQLQRTVTPELEAAVCCIQRCARKFLSNHLRLHRSNLIDRLKLEKTLLSGMRLGLLCLALFLCLLAVSFLEQEKDTTLELGLRQSYISMFGLDELEDLRTVDELNDWLKRASAASRHAQVTSSDYMQEFAEQRVLSGIHTFPTEVSITATDLATDVLVQGFSLTVWLNPPGSGVAGRNKTSNSQSHHVIIRKPIESAVATMVGSPLSCWMFGISWKQVELRWGAHDSTAMNDEVEEHLVLGNITNLWEGPHLLALVVDGNVTAHKQYVSLYVNGEAVLTRQQLKRPITDCDGSILYVGGSDLPMADLTFYPRTLSEAEVMDVLAFGLPLTAIIRGKVSSPRTVSELDTVTEAVRYNRELIMQGQEELLRKNAMEHMLTRIGLTTNGQYSSGLYTDVPTIWALPRAQAGPFSVHLWEFQESDVYLDECTGHNYTDLLPGRIWNFSAGVLFNIPDLPMHLRMDQFPPEFTLSMWMKPNFGYMVASVIFQAYHIGFGTCWSVGWVADRNSVGMTGGFLDESNPDIPDWEHYGLTREDNVLRFVAFTQEVLPNGKLRWTTYLDGAFADEHVVEPVPWDCDMLLFPGTEGDPGLGAAPHQGFRGMMQQPRVYDRALTPTEVREIHAKSKDPQTGEALRQCLDAEDTMDFDVAGDVDRAGHSCEWYNEARKTFPEICGSEEILKSCPIACGVRKICWYARNITEPAADEGFIQRMFRLEHSGNDISCQAETAALLYGDKCINDTAAPTCRFEDHWREGVTSTVNDTDEITLFMWVQLLPSDSPKYSIKYTNQRDCLEVVQINIDTSRSLIQLSMPISPQDGGWRRYEFSTKVPEGTFAIGKWFLLATSLSSYSTVIDATTTLPQRFMWLTVNSRSIRIPTSEPALRSVRRLGDNLVPDAFTVTNSLILSSLFISPFVTPAWAIQNFYYTTIASMPQRPGSRNAENELGNLKVHYQTGVFRSPAFLLAPPLILQTRSIGSLACPTETGTKAIHKVQELVRATCLEEPYSCPGSDSMEADALIPSCKQGDQNTPHYGREIAIVEGFEEEGVYGEFLVTATEASYIGRGLGRGDNVSSNLQVYATENIVDLQSSWVRLIILLAAPGFKGRVSSLVVLFTITSRVKATFQIDHFRALDSGSAYMWKFMTAVSVTIVMASLLLVDVLTRICWSIGRGHRAWPKKSEIFDILFGSFVIFLAVGQSWNNRRSSSDLVAHLDRLMTEDRWHTNSSLEEKFQSFITDNAQLAQDMEIQAMIRLVSIFVAFLALLRFIVATQTHPRIAIVMDTLSRGFDAMVHYLILLGLFFFSFVTLGIFFFGGKYEEFESVATTTELLLTVMTTGEYPTGTFNEEFAFILYILATIIIFFFLMLNFVLAIVVDSYAKVQHALDVLEIEQFVFLDMASTLMSCFFRWWYCWPSVKDIINGLNVQAARNSCTVDSLEAVSKTWDRRSRVRFVQFYRLHSFLAPKARQPGQVEEISREVEQRIALMLGKTPASEYDHAVARSKSRFGNAMSSTENLARVTDDSDRAVPWLTGLSARTKDSIHSVHSVESDMPEVESDRAATLLPNSRRSVQSHESVRQSAI